MSNIFLTIAIVYFLGAICTGIAFWKESGRRSTNPNDRLIITFFAALVWPVAVFIVIEEIRENLQ